MLSSPSQPLNLSSAQYPCSMIPAKAHPENTAMAIAPFLTKGPPQRSWSTITPSVKKPFFFFWNDAKSQHLTLDVKNGWYWNCGGKILKQTALKKRMSSIHNIIYLYLFFTKCHVNSRSRSRPKLIEKANRGAFYYYHYYYDSVLFIFICCIIISKNVNFYIFVRFFHPFSLLCSLSLYTGMLIF